MSNSKRQSLIIIGFGLIIIAGIILYFALSSPKISDNSALSQTVTKSVSDNNTSTSKTSQDVTTVNSAAYPINLNDCTVDELITIDGIGEVKASAIIEYRELIGGYTSVEEIKNIKGIGDKIYEKISPYLCV